VGFSKHPGEPTCSLSARYKETPGQEAFTSRLKNGSSPTYSSEVLRGLNYTR